MFKRNFSYSTKELNEMIKDFSIKPSHYHSFEQKKSMEKIGITGASGFLGLHLVDKLSQMPEVKTIRCFIRSYDTFEVRKKLYELSFSSDKIEIAFEVSPQNTKDLSRLIHCAAHVNNLKTLSGLWQDNVMFTKHVFENSHCPISYISTLSVYASSNLSGSHLLNDISPSSYHFIYGGYAQSKMIGEFLGKHLNDFQCLRLGLLTPNSYNPVISSHEFFIEFLSLIKQFPYYPMDFEEAFVDISPVNLVADKIVSVLTSNQKTVHIANETPTPLSMFINRFNLMHMNNEEWEYRISTLSKMQAILMKYAYLKNKTKKQHPNYFNIDLFQTTGHNWHGDIKTPFIESYLSKIYEKI